MTKSIKVTTKNSEGSIRIVLEFHSNYIVVKNEWFTSRSLDKQPGLYERNIYGSHFYMNSSMIHKRFIWRVIKSFKFWKWTFGSLFTKMKDKDYNDKD
jgi:hypothetical protein